MVYVLDLASNCVKLGGRCWVDNKNYWVARCDLLEKTKLRFDSEGIQFAFPQLDLHIKPNELKIGEIGQSTGNAQPVFSDHNPGDEENI